MHKRTIVGQIEITQDGTIQVRCLKQVVDDNGAILASEYHRTSIPPGGDCDETLAVVNRHLGSMNCALIEEGDWKQVKDHAAVAWTPARVEATKALARAAEK